jgi:putative copper resistance protein D
VIDPLIIIRSVHLAATVFATGTIFFVVLVAMPAGRETGVPVSALAVLLRSFNRIAWAALAIAFLSGTAWLVLVAMDAADATIDDVFLHGDVSTLLIETRFGQIWIARAILLLMLGISLCFENLRLVQLLAATGLISLLGVIGHAGATPGTIGYVHLASDVAHLFAAGAWLGALPAFAILFARAGKMLERETFVRSQRIGFRGWGCSALPFF